MPTYEYNCKSCGETIEVFQAFTDKPLQKHPGCGGELKKVFHPRGIVFKGSGFYATDKRAASNGSGDTTGGKDTKAKKETKPTASKPEAASAAAAD